MEYNKFLQQKMKYSEYSGFAVRDFPNYLFPFQKDCVRWSLKKGKSTLFQDCGLGKTIQQLVWADKVFRYERKNVLILAPLSVSKQTQREGEKFGIRTHIVNTQNDVKNGINITNYEKLHHFDSSKFVGIVLDESSILKSYSGKFRNQIISKFKETPYKLACTATAAPNDYTELGNHSEFLGVLTRSEMLSTFFINDTGDCGTWRLKKHASNEFWKWVCSWAVFLRKPSDLEYDNGDFILPKIHYYSHILSAERHTGFIPKMVKGLKDRNDQRKKSLEKRIKIAADLINASDESWIIWCERNIESNMLSKVINNSVEINGSHMDDFKTNALINFASGQVKKLITKPSIAGFGMNFQVCHNVCYIGLSDSFESFYQTVRRCWRFGQKNEVNIHIIYSEEEGPIIHNVKRKEKDFNDMYNEMSKFTIPVLKKELRENKIRSEDYQPKMNMEIPIWLK